MASAVARPIPLLAPVMSATFSLNMGSPDAALNQKYPDQTKDSHRDKQFFCWLAGLGAATLWR
jgi:hypothetical protein